MKHIFKDVNVEQQNGVFIAQNNSAFENQAQTNEAFSNKWLNYSKEKLEEQNRAFEFQKKWYLSLYGFETEAALARYLKTCKTILDAGCGLGYKAHWFAQLSPETHVVGIDFSEAIFVAQQKFSGPENLTFVKGDIGNTLFNDEIFDYVSCDQVIHHTENVAQTYKEMNRVLRPGGQFAVYMYAKKALPRELLDEHFRTATKSLSHEQLLELSEQLTQLGKMLSELEISLDFPEIPLLNIKGGNMDIQRFIYWNFVKCFWNEELGHASSVSTNYDWYSPSNATRYSLNEFLAFARDNNMQDVYVHSEEACYSGRFKK